MYAIVKIAGQQYKLEPSARLFVPKLTSDEGAVVTFDEVLLLDDGKAITVGDPIVKGTSVTSKVLRHVKDDKVIVFKKKRREQYQVKRGHRQEYTEIEVTSIGAKGN